MIVKEMNGSLWWAHRSWTDGRQKTQVDADGSSYSPIIFSTKRAYLSKLVKRVRRSAQRASRSQNKSDANEILHGLLIARRLDSSISFECHPFTSGFGSVLPATGCSLWETMRPIIWKIAYSRVQRLYFSICRKLLALITIFIFT